MTDAPAIPSLYKTDREIARLVGVGEKRWRANAVVLERAGLPKRDPLFSDRRYWPAVKAFLDRRAGLDADSPAIAPDGAENWEERAHA